MQNEVGASPANSNVQGGNPKSAPAGMIEGSTTHAIHNKEESLMPPSNRGSFSFAMLILNLVALLSILAAGYFWWMGRNTADTVEEKKLKLQSIDQQIKAPAMVKVEKDANDFKTSVGVLSKAKKDRYSITEFLPQFYSKITNDVTISSLSLSSDGSLAIAGKTKSYRTTADLVMALRSWNSLSDVTLSSVSMSAAEGEVPKATFSISAKLKKTVATSVSAAGESATPSTSTSSSATSSTSTSTSTTPTVTQPSTSGGTQ